MKMVSVSNLKKRHMTTSPQWMISLSTLRRARYSVFLGPNGAGKTSTINMIIGLSRPTAGEITVNGIDVRKQTKKPRLLWESSRMKVIFTTRWTGLTIFVLCSALWDAQEGKRVKSLSTFRALQVERCRQTSL